MGQQLKIILTVVVILVLAGLGGIGLYYANQKPAEPEIAEKQDKEAVKEREKTPESAESTVPTGETAAPSFDIVRVEPSGEVVAAGRSSAGAMVELLLGDDVISSARANEGGEWALVFDKPLEPGSYDLALRATGPGGEGEKIEGDRVTVVIEGPDKTPLVAVTRPGQPTEVLQKPAEIEVAAAQPQPQSQPVAEQQATPTAPAAEQKPVLQETAEAAPQSNEQTTAEQPSAGEPASQEQSSTAATAEQPAAREQDAQSQPAQSQPPSQPVQQAAPAAEVAIETVEVEDPDRFMLGGRAGAGQAVRIYLNNERLADVETGADGRWTMSTERPLPPGRYEVRVDAIGADGSVEGRAEVKFDRVQVVAEADQPAERETAGSGGTSTAEGATAGGTAGGSGQGSEVTIVSGAASSGATGGGSSVGEGAGTSVVVIARGDNLWRIARKIYGQGVRHTVIFQANKNQIRNPNLIYPGQVFTIPVIEDGEAAKG